MYQFTKRLRPKYATVYYYYPKAEIIILQDSVAMDFTSAGIFLDHIFAYLPMPLQLA